MKVNLPIQLKHALCNDTSHIKINYFHQTNLKPNLYDYWNGWTLVERPNIDRQLSTTLVSTAIK